MYYYKELCVLILLFQSVIGIKAKSSLTFVIDDTDSMSEDLKQVKYGINLIFDTVLYSNASPIENFVLVTFNDQGTRLQTVTNNRDVFKHTLEDLYMHNGDGECPKLAMAGIELALTKSLPGSYLYVLTDATAKDGDLLKKVQDLAMQKNSQVVFFITGSCGKGDIDRQAYYELANVTNGQVFHVTKHNVGEILNYVAETISSRKTVISSTKFSPGYNHSMTILIDSDMKDIVFAGSGIKPKMYITSPDGKTPYAERLVDLPNVFVMKVKGIMPGNYTAKIGSESNTSVVVTASTGIHFKHAFAVPKPISEDATSLNPLPDEKTHLTIQLITTSEDAVLNEVILTDIEDNHINEMNLTLIDSKKKLYETKLFTVPNKLIKITVKGYENKSKSSFTRTGSTAVGPQNTFLDITERYESRAPTVKIEGGPNITAEYNESLKLSCIVNGSPKPEVFWYDGNSQILKSNYSTKERPDNYINVLTIDTIKEDVTYTCKAVNTLGEALETVHVKTTKKNVLEIIEAPIDTTIKYGNAGQITCKVNADPPAEIKWFSNGKELRPDTFIDMSSDNSVLTIKNMRKHLNGTYVCKAKSDGYEQQFLFKVIISGFERPQINETSKMTSVKRGEDAEIPCRIVKGEPAPKIVWHHLSAKTQKNVTLNDSSEVLHLSNVNEENAGVYQCSAINDAGSEYHKVELTVGYPPVIRDDKTRIRSRVGADITLKCRTKGIPRPNVEWFRNNVKILSDKKHHIHKDNSLRFTGSTDNTGNFTCVATSPLGSVNRTVNIIYFAPVTIDPPIKSTFEVMKGSSLRLPCNANGYPKPTIKWIFFSSIDKRIPLRSIRPSDASGSLYFRRLKPTQEGNYTCVASNFESSQNISYRVVFTEPPKIERRPTKSFSGYNGDLVLRIPCKATGYPKPDITWLKGGFTVALGSEYDMENDGTLVIKNLSKMSAGSYSCNAQNFFGNDMQTFNVNVKELPVKPTTETTSSKKGNLDEKLFNITHTTLKTNCCNKAVQINDTLPENCTAKVGNESESNVVVATSSIYFKHGFSVFKPSSIDATSINPIAGEKNHLAIQLITTSNNAVLNEVIITDLKNKNITEMRLKLIDAEQKLYNTKLFIPPNKAFQIAVKGYDYKSKSPFTRTGLTPVVMDPQKTFLERYEGRAPTVKIEGGPNIIAEYNETLKLSCIVNGFPKPDALWLDINGQILKSAYSTLQKPYDYVNVFTINTVKKTATYTCNATNTYGETSETVLVKTVNIFEVIEAPSNTTIKYRNAGQITCKIYADPPAEIKWFRKDKELRPNHFFHMSPDNSVLTIKNMRKHLSGIYYCGAQAESREQNFVFKVNMSGFERPQINKTEIETSVKKGEDAEIHCRIIKGEPTPKIIWHRYIEKAQKFINLNESGNNLHFPNVSEVNAGFYRCSAKNNAGWDHHIVELIVEYPPAISQDKTYVRSRVGRKTMLRCRSQGVPKPRVYWFRNSVRINSDKEYHVYRDNSLGFTVSTDNAGYYTCVASNRLGTAKRTTRVYYFVPVTIASPIESTFEVVKGGSLELPCKADGYPKASVKWIFFSSINKKIPPRRISPSDTSGRLNLRKLKGIHDGYYICIARNVGSSYNISYRVKITELPRIQRVSTTNFSGVMGDLVLKIPCKATGYPKPDMTWTKGGFSVALGYRRYDIENDGTLVIKNLDKESAGSYSCNARNLLGSDMQTFYVIVYDFPIRAIPIKTITLEKGKAEKVECNIPHTKLDTIRWYKGRRLIHTNHSLNLENVTESDSGVYTCRVCNFVNSTSGSTMVIVGYKPGFVDEVETFINYNEGLPAFLNCYAKSQPQPQVYWFHKDKNIDHKDFTYELLMTFNGRGKYTCVVSNSFGSINRTFEISSKDCILSLKENFAIHQPLMIDNDSMKWPEFENRNGNLVIPRNKSVLLYCPSGFKNFSTSKITTVCNRESEFLVDGHTYNYESLNCQKEVPPVIKRTNEKCTSANTERVKIGYEVLGDFLEVFEVCFDKQNNIPVFAKQEMHRSLANVEFKEPIWQDDSLQLEFDKLYKCDNQMYVISSVLQKWFHFEDRCCFGKRQLVNTRDLIGGLPQQAALNYLNIIPHWSTCSSKNWDELENRVRKLAKASLDNLLVWTGTFGQLEIKSSTGNMEKIALRDYSRGQRLPVPLYLWKVIQNPATKSSLAVVQLNIPDVSTSEAYEHMLCRDVCRDVEWMSGIHWRDPTKGYTFCCSLPDFERVFGYEGVFGTDNNNIIRNIPYWDTITY